MRKYIEPEAKNRVVNLLNASIPVGLPTCILKYLLCYNGDVLEFVFISR